MLWATAQSNSWLSSGPMELVPAPWPSPPELVGSDRSHFIGGDWRNNEPKLPSGEQSFTIKVAPFGYRVVHAAIYFRANDWECGFGIQTDDGKTGKTIVVEEANAECMFQDQPTNEGHDPYSTYAWSPLTTG